MKNADVAGNEFSAECNGATHNADNRDDLSQLDITTSLCLDNKWWMRLSLSHPPEAGDYSSPAPSAGGLPDVLYQ